MADDADGNEVDPFGENPFANLPLFGDLSRALAGQGPLNWDCLLYTSDAADERVRV